MGNEDKLNEAINKNKFEKYGLTRKSFYSIIRVLACILLIVIVSIAHVGFNKEFYKNIDYWINLTILCGLAIFGMFTGEQMGDDINRNNPKGRFRRSLGKYSAQYEKVDQKKLFSYFEDWLDFYRDRKLKKKIKDILKENGIHQLEVLDLDLSELSNLSKPFKKDWKGTENEKKYYNAKKNESITYFMSYDEEQIELIKFCKKGKVKVSKLPSSFFTDALNVYEKDMWESAAHSQAKKNAYLSLNTTYKLFGLLAFSFLMAGLEPLADGDTTAQEVLYSLFSKLFTLITSIIWGMYIGMELVKIDTTYLDYKIRMLSLYEEEYDLKIFNPKSIEQKAEEEYLKNETILEQHSIEKQEEIENEQQENILD